MGEGAKDKENGYVRPTLSAERRGGDLSRARKGNRRNGDGDDELRREKNWGSCKMAYYR